MVIPPFCTLIRSAKLTYNSQIRSLLKQLPYNFHMCFLDSVVEWCLPKFT